MSNKNFEASVFVHTVTKHFMMVMCMLAFFTIDLHAQDLICQSLDMSRFQTMVLFMPVTHSSCKERAGSGHETTSFPGSPLQSVSISRQEEPGIFSHMQEHDVSQERIRPGHKSSDAH